MKFDLKKSLIIVLAVVGISLTALGISYGISHHLLQVGNNSELKNDRDTRGSAGRCSIMFKALSPLSDYSDSDYHDYYRHNYSDFVTIENDLGDLLFEAPCNEPIPEIFYDYVIDYINGNNDFYKVDEEYKTQNIFYTDPDFKQTYRYNKSLTNPVTIIYIKPSSTLNKQGYMQFTWGSKTVSIPIKIGKKYTEKDILNLLQDYNKNNDYLLSIFIYDKNNNTKRFNEGIFTNKEDVRLLVNYTSGLKLIFKDVENNFDELMPPVIVQANKEVTSSTKRIYFENFGSDRGYYNYFSTDIFNTDYYTYKDWFSKHHLGVYEEYNVATGTNVITFNSLYKSARGTNNELELFSQAIIRKHLVSFEYPNNHIEVKKIDHNKRYIDVYGYDLPDDPEYTDSSMKFDYWKDKATGEHFYFNDVITKDITLVPVWKSTGNKEYKVYFDWQGGTNGPATMTWKPNRSNNLPIVAPYLENHNFVGWGVETNESVERKYGLGDNIEYLNADLYLVAMYEPVKYTMTFTGCKSLTTKEKEYGKDFVLPHCTEPPIGQYVQYWIGDDNVTYTTGSSYSKNKKATFTASYAYSKYTLTFNFNDNSTPDEERIVKYNDTLSNLPTPEVDANHEFLGWYTSNSVNKNGRYYKNGDVYKEAQNKTLYAIYKEKNTTLYHTVTYNVNEGTPTLNSQTVEHGQKISKPTVGKNGYVLIEWQDEFGKAFNFTDDVINRDITLKAIWEKDYNNTSKYTVKFYDGSTLLDTQEVYDGDLVVVDKEKTAKPGHHIINWYTSPTLDAESRFTFDTPITATTKLYAKYSANQIVVEFAADSNATISSSTYYVKYNTEIGRSVYDNNNIQLPTATRPNYTFNGWFYDIEYTHEVSAQDIVTTEEPIVVYAKFTRDTEISYGDVNDDGSIDNKDLTLLFKIVSGQTAMEQSIKNADVNGDGSLTNKDSVALFQFINEPSKYPNTLPDNPISATSKITISYNKNTESEVSNMPSNQEKTSNVDINLANNVPTRTDGQVFVSWNTDSLGKGASYAPGALYQVNESVVLFAQWQEVENATYSITYHGNAEGVTNIPSPGTKNKNETYKISPTIPVRDGYEFLGWNSKDDYTGQDYEPNGSYTLNANLDLYANWKKIELDITKISNYTLYDEKVLFDEKTLSRSLQVNSGYSINYTAGSNKRTSDYIATGDTITISKGNTTKEYTAIVLGDIVPDGEITILDYVRTFQHVKKQYYAKFFPTISLGSNYSLLTDVLFNAADLDQDKDVDLMDSVQIFNIIKNKFRS